MKNTKVIEKITPYKSPDNKKDQIKKMFNSIAESYDFLNRIISFNMDQKWRRIAVQKIKNNPQKILDIATGTADFAITAAKYTNAQIIGVDISENMLSIGQKKIEKNKLSNRILLKKADGEKLPFKTNSFPTITIGFGVRNYENIDKGLSELYRVLCPNGIIIIIEPSQPSQFPIKQLYNIYSTYIIPIIGTIISKDKKAYQYLNKSIEKFPSGISFLKKLEHKGFKNCQQFPLNLGTISIYTATK